MGHRDTKNLQPKTREKLEKIKQILSSGSKTLRRVFYMVASGSYDSLGKLLTWARLNDEIDWEDIVEEGRKLMGVRSYENVEDFVDSMIYRYVKNKESCFKKHIEVWLEKATLQGFFSEITNKYDIGLLTTRGRMSWTALKEASERLDSNSVIIYFGDNDSYGVEMYEQNKDFLSQLGCNPTFIRPALTDEQEESYNFPSGEHHIDGMPEEELKKLLECSIRKYIDLKKFNSLLKQEEEEKKALIKKVEELRGDDDEQY